VGVTIRLGARFVPALAVPVLIAAACSDLPRRPLDPTASEQRLKARSLADPQLRDLGVSKLGLPAEPWPPKEADRALLTLAAWHFRPEMAQARVRIEGAEASARAAGHFPNPSIGVTPGRVTNTADSSPWILSAVLDFTIPIGGRLGKEQALADQEVELARLDAAATAWRIQAEVRDAVADVIYAQDVGYSRTLEQRHRSDQARVVEQRAAAGLASRGEAQTARVEADRATNALALARLEVPAAYARLAAATGLPALEGVRVLEPPFAEVPLEGAALDRLDLRRTLAEYESDERALELELARQYPDLHLGPGFEYDQGERKYLLGVGIELPLFDRNEAGIARADAKRRDTAARFETLQANALSEMEIARGRLLATRERVMKTQMPAMRRVHDRVSFVVRSFQRGGSDAFEKAAAELDFDRVLLEGAVDKREWLRAEAAWEEASQRPLDPRVATLGDPP
jgi:outer membrane protein TolC